MLITLIKYLGILFIGGIFGYKDKIKGKIEANLANIQTLALLFLLFIMGITIGINDEIISNIFSIGLKAGIITIFTMGFSILGVRLVSKYVVLEDEEIEP
ncbi:MAG: LysO family transporter [Tissierellaceae bacterium]